MLGISLLKKEDGSIRFSPLNYLYFNLNNVVSDTYVFNNQTARLLRRLSSSETSNTGPSHRCDACAHGCVFWFSSQLTLCQSDVKRSETAVSILIRIILRFMCMEHVFNQACSTTKLHLGEKQVYLGIAENGLCSVLCCDLITFASYQSDQMNSLIDTWQNRNKCTSQRIDCYLSTCVQLQPTSMGYWRHLR